MGPLVTTQFLRAREGHVTGVTFEDVIATVSALMIAQIVGAAELFLADMTTKWTIRVRMCALVISQVARPDDFFVAILAAVVKAFVHV